VRHLLPRRGVVGVAVGPLVQAHLRARERHALGRPLGHGNALAVVVDRDRRLVAVSYFLSIFNGLCMRSKIRCDGES
jgi:hypothetical protein